MSNQISASEAIYGFCSWLTTRKKVMTMSSYHVCASVIEDIGLFCRANGLSEPRENWTDNLVHPDDFQKNQVLTETKVGSIPGNDEALDYAGG